mmetsp:Transcript_75123/g.213669  ORF Transcript_75123/g.213669 Transcript_75123/m.213669 type:complete len:223 (+) Transcript_75123:212-880(+)
MADPCIPRAGGHGVRVEPEDALFKMLEEGAAREYCPDLQNCPAGWQQTRVVRRGHDGGDAAPVTTAGTGSESYQLLVDSPGPQEGEVILSAAQVGERWEVAAVVGGYASLHLCSTPPPATITFTFFDTRTTKRIRPGVPLGSTFPPTLNSRSGSTTTGALYLRAWAWAAKAIPWPTHVTLPPWSKVGAAAVVTRRDEATCCGKRNTAAPGRRRWWWQRSSTA